MDDMRKTRNRSKTKRPRSGNLRDVIPESLSKIVLPPIGVSTSKTSKQTPLSARAISPNVVQRHKQQQKELQHMKEKEKQQAECIENLSKDKQVLDTKLSDIKIEVKEFVRQGLCKETRDRRRLENLATKKYDNMESIYKDQISENTERYERLATRIGNIEQNHLKLENQISSNHIEIMGILTQQRNEAGYTKTRRHDNHTLTSVDEDLDYDETPKRKKMRKT